MNRLLILTKNISVEHYLQEQLQKLNYEVLVSVSIWESWEQSGTIDPFLQSFQWIFLSETLSDQEVSRFGEYVNSDCLVRIVGEEPSEAEVSEWLISDWILATASLERLREKLVHKSLTHQVAFFEEQRVQPFYGDSPLSELKKQAFPICFSDIHFTKLEKDIINRLVAAKDLSLAREELCHGWRSKNQNSKLSQLSSSITRIRKKVLDTYGIKDAVMTVWGEGYQLNTYFYHCLLKGEFQNYSQSIRT